ncbi:MAG: hypothetical protein K2L30_00705 [Duncaniella sp.]|nr:hypothetical protein [Duncaniella sp.]
MQDEGKAVVSESETAENGVVDNLKNEQSSVKTYIVSDGCAGPFRIGSCFPKNPKGATVTEFMEEKALPDGLTLSVPVSLYETGNEGWVKVTARLLKNCLI